MPKEQLIQADGTTYRFVPGPGGSLTDTRVQPTNPIYTPRPSVSKVVPMLRSLRKQQAGQPDQPTAQVGSVRG